MGIGQNIKKGWNWVWNSDSIWSWIVALIIIIIFVKFGFFPAVSLITGTSLPIVGVESSSMDHQIVADDYGRLNICGQIYTSSQKVHLSFDDYWNVCGNWYDQRNITKEEFSKFSLDSGFSKGDIIIVWGRFTPRIGDIIIFRPGSTSIAPNPIIHRIVSIDNGIIQTKGDHNQDQLRASNNLYKTDETDITASEVVGKAVFRIPYLGWPKIWLSQLLGTFSG